MQDCISLILRSHFVSTNQPINQYSYDLTIARTDNQVDMRYLINMDYSADLPINSLGRRVRSRLYFTSESHLHSSKLLVGHSLVFINYLP